MIPKAAGVDGRGSQGWGVEWGSEENLGAFRRARFQRCKESTQGPTSAEQTEEERCLPSSSVCYEGHEGHAHIRDIASLCCIGSIGD